MLLSQGLSAALEAALNHYLRLDSAVLPRLAALSGKVIAIELTGLNTGFYLLPNAGGIQVLGQWEGPPDVRLRGTPLGLLRLGAQKGSGSEVRSTLFSGTVEMSGDVELGQRFKQILDDIDIDWEELLSKLTGDVLAHKIGNALRAGHSWGKQTLAAFGQNFAEYQQEEARNLPSQPEVEQFLQAVDELRDDVERMELRLRRLQEHLK